MPGQFNKLTTATLTTLIICAFVLPNFARAQVDPFASTSVPDFITQLRQEYDSLYVESKDIVESSSADDDVINRVCDSGRASNIQPGNGEANSSSGGQDPVPVFEVGPLLTLVGDIDKVLYGVLDGTRSIDSNTMQIKDISVDICYYLKSIRRIQYDFQNKIFAEDPAARRNAGLKTLEYAKNYTNFVQNGRDLNGDGYPDAPLYAQSITEITQGAADAANSAFYDNLSASGNLYNNTLANIFAIEDAGISNGGLTSDLTQEEVQSVYTNPDSLDPDTFWYRLKRFLGGPNNIYTSYNNARQIRNLGQEIARQNALNEYLAGSGYMPYKQCLLQTRDEQYCRIAVAITPGSTIKDLFSSALNSKLVQMETADKQGADTIPGMDPNIGNVTNPDTRDQLSPDNQSVTPSPSPDIFNPTEKLTVNLSASSTGSEGGAKKLNIQLETNADSCVATNNWVSMQDAQLSRLISKYKHGEDVAPNSTTDVYYPLIFDLQFYRDRAGSRTDITLASTTGAVRFFVVKIPDAMSTDIRIGDAFTLSLPPFGGAETFSTTTSASSSPLAIISDLYRQIGLSSSEEIDKYLGTPPSSNYFTIQASSLYGVKCTKGNQTKNASIRVYDSDLNP